MIGVLEQTGWIGFKCVDMSVWSDELRLFLFTVWIEWILVE